MKQVDIGQTITILANVGVITGILFLAIEINQTNEQLAAQERGRLFALRSGVQDSIVFNVGGIAELRAKARSGAALTDLEAERLNSRRFQVLRTFEYMVQESPDGALSQVFWMASFFRDEPGLIDTWERIANDPVWDPEFISFIEENVLPAIDRVPAFQ